MKKIFAVAIASAALLTPVAASAGERVTDAALGAVSGALVAGPIGLVAGGVIGYAAGPDIARGMGIRHDHRAPRRSAANHREKAAEARSDAR